MRAQIKAIKFTFPAAACNKWHVNCTNIIRRKSIEKKHGLKNHNQYRFTSSRRYIIEKKQTQNKTANMLIG